MMALSRYPLTGHVGIPMTRTGKIILIVPLHFDSLVESLELQPGVIPTQAPIQSFQYVLDTGTSPA